MKVLLSLLFVLISALLIFSQAYSLDMNLNARAIALGESFVANPTGIPSADNNPATIIENNNFNVSYTRRDDGWLKNSKAVFYSLGTSVKTPIGYWELGYKRYNSDILITTVENPDGNGEYIWDHTMSLSYANYLSEDFAIGMTLKTCTSDYGSRYGFNKPLLIDVGLLFSSNGLIEQEKLSDRIFIGAAIQNFGGRLKRNYETGSFDQYYYPYNLPRYVKLGLTYELDFKKNGTLSFYKIIVSSEYREQTSYNINYNDSKNRYPVENWCLGIENIFYEVFFLRVGSILNAHSNQYGETNKLNLRFGAGINLPLNYVIKNVPVSLQLDYANIPVNTNYFGENVYLANKNLWAFNIQLSYNNPLF
jgi:hypothetical protein